MNDDVFALFVVVILLVCVVVAAWALGVFDAKEGAEPTYYSGGISGAGVMWIGRDPYRMPCVTYKKDDGYEGYFGWSCYWPACGDEENPFRCLKGLPDLGELVVSGE